MREKELSTRIIFVRHGQTNFPIDRIYCDDRENPALNKIGQRQAESTADILGQISIDAIYASPVLRTTMTAEVIASRHTLPITFGDALVERRFGVWEGLYFNEIEQGYPEEYRQWKMDQAGFAPEAGESAFDLLNRVSVFVGDIVNNNKGKTVVVVSHVGPIRVLLADALGLSLKAFRSLRIDPASMSRVDYGAKQNNLVYMNYVGLDRLTKF